MIKPSLLEIQRNFLQAIKTRDFSALSPTLIKAKGNFTPKSRFNIYSNAYWIRINESIKEDYPQLRDLLNDKFDDIIFEYLLEYPSKYPGLGEASKNLPAFFEVHYPSYAKLAKLDYATLISKNSAWPILFEAQRARILDPSLLFQLNDSESDAYIEEDIELLWNTSIVVVDGKIVFQRNGKSTVLDASLLELKLISQAERILNFKNLIEQITLQTDSFEEVQSLFAKWAENEILFFMRANTSLTSHH